MAEVESYLVTGSWRHVIEDSATEPDTEPDVVRPTGHVVFTPLSPRWAIAGVPATSYSVARTKALIADGQLRDVQGREGVQLAGLIGTTPVRWKVEVHLEYNGKPIEYPDLEFELTGPAHLTALIRNDVSGEPPFVIDPRIEAMVGQAQTLLTEVLQVQEQVFDGVETAQTARDEAVAAKVEWKGLWSASTAYATRDVVSHNGSSWWAVRPSTGVTPVEGADWSLLAAKGDTGVSPTLSDATATVKGAVALAGNLSGTADAPTVTTTYTSDPSAPAQESSTLDQFASDMAQGLGYVYEYVGGALGMKADLDGNGKVVASQIPALAVTEFLGTVASQAAMLALTGQKGDWCIRTDTSTTWIITGDNPAQVSSWTQLATPASGVSSVAGRTGAVTLSKADVGLSQVDNTSDANKPISSAVSTALAGKASSTHTHTPASLGAVASSGTTATLWSGTQAQYDALSAATRNAAGFVAVIMP